MYLRRKLYSYILLGIFQVFVLHQGFPHEHHEHDKPDHVDIAPHKHVHSHHHSNEHQHHHDATGSEQKSTNNQYQGLLGFILGDHSHSYNFNLHPVVTNPVVKSDNAENFGGALATSTGFSNYDTDIVALRIAYNPPEFLNKSYSPYFNHRGPPTII